MEVSMNSYKPHLAPNFITEWFKPSISTDVYIFLNCTKIDITKLSFLTTFHVCIIQAVRVAVQWTSPFSRTFLSFQTETGSTPQRPLHFQPHWFPNLHSFTLKLATAVSQNCGHKLFLLNINNYPQQHKHGRGFEFMDYSILFLSCNR